ncbi:MAG TPA: TRAP transporter small permease subunit [Rhodospirillales bacterium]|nr:TRAP transporter small permease subunit [Rhodospirillales bacterium]
MPNSIILFVRYVEAVTFRVGRFAMYLIFAMLGVLLYSSIMKTFFLPSLWTLETAQFLMVAYYMLGGGYSMQLGEHVRMDLFYGQLSSKKKGFTDSLTSISMITYLIVLLYGGLSSTQYALLYGEKSYSSWAPYMAPIKIIMSFGIALMLLQSVAVFFRDLARARGLDVFGPNPAERHQS